MYAHVSRLPRKDEPGDWSASYRHHPALFLGLAAGVGLVFGIMKARRSSRPSHTVSDGLVPAPPKLPLRERSAKVSQLVSSWQDVSDALLAVGIAKAVEAIAAQVPGFKGQYERRSAMRDSFRSTEMLSSSR